MVSVLLPSLFPEGLGSQAASRGLPLPSPGGRSWVGVSRPRGSCGARPGSVRPGGGREAAALPNNGSSGLSQTSRGTPRRFAGSRRRPPRPLYTAQGARVYEGPSSSGQRGSLLCSPHSEEPRVPLRNVVFPMCPNEPQGRTLPLPEGSSAGAWPLLWAPLMGPGQRAVCWWPALSLAEGSWGCRVLDHGWLLSGVCQAVPSEDGFPSLCQPRSWQRWDVHWWWTPRRVKGDLETLPVW